MCLVFQWLMIGIQAPTVNLCLLFISVFVVTLAPTISKALSAHKEGAV